jgi:Domain of unknown function (DUF4189)
MCNFGIRRVGIVCVLMVLIMACMLVAPGLWGEEAKAAGAMAVGIATGGAQNGFSFGMNSDKATEAAAQADALEACRRSKESNAKAHARCMSVGTFVNQCGSIAMDPKDGTPGVGWAIAPDTATANRYALANCEATAGVGRAGTCKVSATRCDGAAK